MSRRFKTGFSLTEVLMAAGILAIGFILIAMIFPVGIKLTSSATERTIGVVVANEAVNKLKIYANDLLTMDFGKFRFDAFSGLNEVMLFEDVIGPVSVFYTTRMQSDTNGNPVYERFYEMLYPSLDNYCDAGDYAFGSNVLSYRSDVNQASYRWSALCVETGIANQVQTLILVTRKLNKNVFFPVPQWDSSFANYGYIDTTLNLNAGAYPYPHAGDWPLPVRVDLICVDAPLRIWQIDTSIDTNAIRYISEGDTVIDTLYNGGAIQHFRVIDKDRYGIELDDYIYRPDPDTGDNTVSIGTRVAVWAVPPAIGSSRSPLVEVSPGRTITFK